MSLSVKRLAGDVFDEITKVGGKVGGKTYKAAMWPLDKEAELVKPISDWLTADTNLDKALYKVIPGYKYVKGAQRFGVQAALSPSSYLGPGEAKAALKVGERIPMIGRGLSAADRLNQAVKQANTTRNVSNIIKVKAQGELVKGQAKRVPKFAIRIGDISVDKSGQLPDFYGHGVLNRLKSNATEFTIKGKNTVRRSISEVGSAGFYLDTTMQAMNRTEGSSAIRNYVKIRNPEKLKILDVGTRDGRVEMRKIHQLAGERFGKESRASGQTIAEIAQERGWDGVLNGGVKSDYNAGELVLFNEKHMEGVANTWSTKEDFSKVEGLLKRGEVPQNTYLPDKDFAGSIKSSAMMRGTPTNRIQELEALKEVVRHGDTAIPMDEFAVDDALDFIDKKIRHLKRNQISRGKLKISGASSVDSAGLTPEDMNKVDELLSGGTHGQKEVNEVIRNTNMYKMSSEQIEHMIEFQPPGPERDALIQELNKRNLIERINKEKKAAGEYSEGSIEQGSTDIITTPHAGSLNMDEVAGGSALEYSSRSMGGLGGPYELKRPPDIMGQLPSDMSDYELENMISHYDIARKRETSKVAREVIDGRLDQLNAERTKRLLDTKARYKGGDILGNIDRNISYLDEKIAASKDMNKIKELKAKKKKLEDMKKLRKGMGGASGGDLPLDEQQRLVDEVAFGVKSKDESRNIEGIFGAMPDSPAARTIEEIRGMSTKELVNDLNDIDSIMRNERPARFLEHEINPNQIENARTLRAEYSSIVDELQSRGENVSHLLSQQDRPHLNILDEQGIENPHLTVRGNLDKMSPESILESLKKIDTELADHERVIPAWEKRLEKLSDETMDIQDAHDVIAGKKSSYRYKKDFPTMTSPRKLLQERIREAKAEQLKLERLKNDLIKELKRKYAKG